jgi:hypothetical protein
MTRWRPTNEPRKGVARLATMPRPLPFVLSLAAGILVATALVACGSDDEDGTIPQQNASVMLQALDDAEGELEERDCDSLADAAGNLRTAAEDLSDEVDTEVRDAIVEGASNLQTLANDESQCQPATETTGATGAQEEVPTTTTTPPPAETTTEATTTTTTTEPEEEQPQPDNGNQGEGGGPPSPPPGQGGEPPGEGGEVPGGGQGPPESGGIGNSGENGD